jgi:hypothetical protein
MCAVENSLPRSIAPHMPLPDRFYQIYLAGALLSVFQTTLRGMLLVTCSHSLLHPRLQDLFGERVEKELQWNFLVIYTMQLLDTRQRYARRIRHITDNGQETD